MSTIHLGLVFARRGGAVRFLVQVACVALVAALGLVALTVARFSGGGYRYGVSNLLADGGVRPGYVFALLLVCLVPLTLFVQVVRLGSASRGRRFAQLRLAGASPAQLTAIAVVEVAAPTSVGALLGWPAFLWLRDALGPSGLAQWTSDPDVRRELLLIPPATTAPWWQVALVLVAVLLVGVAVGAGVDRRAIGSERAPSPAGTSPNPWPAVVLLVLGGVLVGPIYTNTTNHAIADPLVFIAIGCAIGGLLVGARWVAWVAARSVAARARSVGLVLATNRLVAESGRAGRAGATIGAIALVAGGGASLAADLVSGSNEEAMYVVPTIAVFVVIAIALVVMTLVLTVHAIETVGERRRSTAALVAGGTPVGVLDRALRWESALVALPVSVAGLFLGAVVPAPFMGATFSGACVRVAVLATFLLLVGLGTLASTWMVRPYLVDAADPANLRAT